MLKRCLDVVTRTLQISISVRKGFRYILFTLETSAQINRFLSKWRVDPVQCPLRYCQKYSFPIVSGLVGLLGGVCVCLLLALVPDKSCSLRWPVLSAVLAYSLLSAERGERWCGGLAAEQAKSCCWAAALRCESWEKEALLFPVTGWRTNSPVLQIAPHWFMCEPSPCVCRVVVLVASAHQYRVQYCLCTMSQSLLPLFKREWIILCKFTQPFSPCNNSASWLQLTQMCL